MLDRAMDAFVRRLIERLHDPSKPLSRNRHFHTFETPEGKSALKTSRRLKSLQRDIRSCLEDGQPASFLRHQTAEGQHRVELRFHKVMGRRTATLTEAEFELLLALPGVQQAFAGAAVSDETEAAPARRTGS